MLIRGFQYGGGSGGGGGASSDGPVNAVQVSNGTGGFAGESAFSYDPATNTVSLASGVQTANNPAFNISQTWDNAAVTFTGLQFNVTNTASGASSLLLDLQVDGISQAFVTRDGGFRGTYFGTAPLNASGSGFIFYGTGNRPKFRYAGVNALEFADSCLVINTGGSLAWASSGISGTDTATVSDLVITRDAANTLAQRNGVNAQTFRVYNTYTDASNYERGVMRWSSNVLEVGTEAAGSGIGRQLTLSAGNGQFSFKSGTGSEGNGCAGRLAYGFTVGAWNPNGSSGGRDVRLNLSGSSVCIDTGNAATAPFTFVNGAQYFFTSSSACFRQGANMTVGAWTRTSDAAVGNVTYTANTAFASATTNITGGAVNILAGNGASSSSGAAHGGHVYLDGGQGYGTGVHGNIIIGNTRGKLQLTPTTVANLGSASPAGQRTFVTDANSTTFHSIVAAGGANFVPVFSDGTNWRIG